MMQHIDEMEQVLFEANCSPERYGDGDSMFKRNLKFYANDVECWIEWWKNLAYLSIGGRYVSYIMFDRLSRNKTWPSFWEGLEFSFRNKDVCFLATIPLDWQKEEQ